MTATAPPPKASLLIIELHCAGITSAALIAELLAISERYALAILTDQGLHQPRPKMTAAQALEACGRDLAQRVNQFRNGTARQHGQKKAA